jgi:uncharacterized membrane protein YebE (DUF533 family)
MDAQTPEDEEALERDAEIIVKPMINAAKAGGQVDEKESENIPGKLGKNGLWEEEKEFFIAEVRKPLDTSSRPLAIKKIELYRTQTTNQ